MVPTGLATTQAQISLLFEQIQDMIEERNRLLKIGLKPQSSDDKDLNVFFKILASLFNSQSNKRVLVNNNKMHEWWTVLDFFDL